MTQQEVRDKIVSLLRRSCERLPCHLIGKAVGVHGNTLHCALIALEDSDRIIKHRNPSGRGSTYSLSRQARVHNLPMLPAQHGFQSAGEVRP